MISSKTSLRFIPVLIAEIYKMQHFLRAGVTTAVTNTQRCPLAICRRNTHQELGIMNKMFFSTKGSVGGDTSHVVTRGPVSWAGLGLAAVLAATAVGYYKIERERRLENAMGKIVSSESGWSPNPELFAPRKYMKTQYGWFPVEDGFGGAGKPAIGGEWSLVDMNGNLVTNKSFEGKWTLLYFGFARCPDICPSEMVKVGKVMDILARDYPDIAKKVKPIFVTVDPARDSIQALREYSKDFHPSYIFLTGSPVQIQQMAKKYRVYVSKADETVDGDYLVDHSIVIYFHDDTGDLADCFTQSMRPSDIVEKMKERMNIK